MATTIDPKEAAHFGQLAADWWDPKGSSAMLHKLNPVRLAYIRARIDAHWGLDEHDLKPLRGKRAVDVGCGAGLLAEPLCRLGAEVTALDAAPENIAVARAHALGQGLEIDYRTGGAEALDGRYDLVTSLEVIEHVADPAAFVRGAKFGLSGDPAAGGLLRRLFSARTLGLFDEIPGTGIADYLSGLLLGCELREAFGCAGRQAVEAGVLIVGGAALAARYRTALDLAEVRSEAHAGEAAAMGQWVIARAAGLVGA